jgi:hypothetical protein
MIGPPLKNRSADLLCRPAARPRPAEKSSGPCGAGPRLLTPRRYARRLIDENISTWQDIAANNTCHPGTLSSLPGR